LLASILALWIGAVLYIQQRGGSLNPVVGRSAGFVETSDDLGHWYNTYVHERLNHAPRGTPTGVQIYAAGTGAEVIRVLVIGDSFTEGIGLRDLSQQWPRQLAQNAARSSGKRVEVVSLSRGGTSTYTHAEWLRAIFAKEPESIDMDPEVFKLLTGTYDAIFVGYVTNDVTYLPGVERLRFFDPQTFDPSTTQKAESGQIADPNDGEYRAALRLIREASGDTPLRFLYLSQIPGEYIERRFAEEGIQVVNVTTHGYGGDEKYNASALDPHPNEIVHREYAARASRVLLALTGGTVRTATAADKEYVSTPTGAKFTVNEAVNGTRIEAVFNETVSTDITKCANVFKQQRIDRGGRLRWTIVCDEVGAEVRSEIGEKKFSGILATCDIFETPYTAFYSAKPLRETIGTRAHIRIESSVKRYTLYLSGYNQDNERTIRKIGTYDGEAEIDVELGAAENGLILGEEGECGRTKINELGPWRVSISTR
jgi:lysophospholipase L1-like esterase